MYSAHSTIESQHTLSSTGAVVNLFSANGPGYTLREKTEKQIQLIRKHRIVTIYRLTNDSKEEFSRNINLYRAAVKKYLHIVGPELYVFLRNEHKNDPLYNDLIKFEKETLDMVNRIIDFFDSCKDSVFSNKLHFSKVLTLINTLLEERYAAEKAFLFPLYEASGSQNPHSAWPKPIN